MIVRLTHGQWQSIRSRGPERVVAWMSEHRRAIGKQHDYVMPAIGWLQLHTELVRTVYGPIGGKLDSTPESLYRAVQRISDRLGAIEAHPGMKPGRGILGLATDVIPAFAAEDGWTPFPSGGDFVILRPRHIRYSQHDITVWEPGASDPEDVTHEVAHHLHFIDG